MVMPTWWRAVAQYARIRSPEPAFPSPAAVARRGRGGSVPVPPASTSRVWHGGARRRTRERRPQRASYEGRLEVEQPAGVQRRIREAEGGGHVGVDERRLGEQALCCRDERIA